MAMIFSLRFFWQIVYQQILSIKTPREIKMVERSIMFDLLIREMSREEIFSVRMTRFANHPMRSSMKMSFPWRESLFNDSDRQWILLWIKKFFATYCFFHSSEKKNKFFHDLNIWFRWSLERHSDKDNLTLEKIISARNSISIISLWCFILMNVG